MPVFTAVILQCLYCVYTRNVFLKIRSTFRCRMSFLTCNFLTYNQMKRFLLMFSNKSATIL